MILKQNKTWKLLKDKLGPYTPALSVVLVSVCVGTSLNGYQTPVFAAPEKAILEEVKSETKEKNDNKTGALEAGNSAVGGSTYIATVQDASSYRDGTYYGDGTGFGGKLRVKVEITDGKIAAIDVVEHSDGSAYMQKASGLISAIIATQSTNVDTVSGATYSSVGIIQAVRIALSQAAVAENGENDSASNLKNENSNTETISGKVPYNEGIYYGTAEGYNGNITVAVVIQDHTIKAILVTEKEDDETFFNRAMNVVSDVMKKQSTEVDVVSGATYSSNGLLGAIRDALKEAERVTKGETLAPEIVSTEMLARAIAEAEALKAEHYTPDSWNTMTIRLEEAKEAMEATEQQRIDTALTNLAVAIRSLIKADVQEESSVYVNGIYTVSVVCKADEDEDFENYHLSALVTIMNDKIVAITDVEGDGSSDNDSYIRRAANGTSKITGVVPQIVETGNADNVDVVSRATCSSNAIVEICRQVLEQAKRVK